jgi:hypothetical protein
MWSKDIRSLYNIKRELSAESGSPQTHKRALLIFGSRMHLQFIKHAASNKVVTILAGLARIWNKFYKKLKREHSPNLSTAFFKVRLHCITYLASWRSLFYFQNYFNFNWDSYSNSNSNGLKEDVINRWVAKWFKSHLKTFKKLWYCVLVC